MSSTTPDIASALSNTVNQFAQAFQGLTQPFADVANQAAFLGTLGLFGNPPGGNGGNGGNGLFDIHNNPLFNTLNALNPLNLLFPGLLNGGGLGGLPGLGNIGGGGGGNLSTAELAVAELFISGGTTECIWDSSVDHFDVQATSTDPTTVTIFTKEFIPNQISTRPAVNTLHTAFVVVSRGSNGGNKGTDRPKFSATGVHNSSSCQTTTFQLDTEVTDDTTANNSNKFVYYIGALPTAQQYPVLQGLGTDRFIKADKQENKYENFGWKNSCTAPTFTTAPVPFGRDNSFNWDTTTAQLGLGVAQSESADFVAAVKATHLDKVTIELPTNFRVYAAGFGLDTNTDNKAEYARTLNVGCGASNLNNRF